MHGLIQKSKKFKNNNENNRYLTEKIFWFRNVIKL